MPPIRSFPRATLPLSFHIHFNCNYQLLLPCRYSSRCGYCLAPALCILFTTHSAYVCRKAQYGEEAPVGQALFFFSFLFCCLVFVVRRAHWVGSHHCHLKKNKKGSTGSLLRINLGSVRAHYRYAGRTRPTLFPCRKERTEEKKWLRLPGFVLWRRQPVLKYENRTASASADH